MEAAAGTGGQNAKIETAQDIQTWFTGYGIEVDGASITADKVKIPRKWDDSFSAFNTVVGQSGLDLERYKGKTVEKWQALIPAASNGEESCYGVLLVYKKKPVGAYLLAKPSGLVTGLGDAQAAMAEADEAEAAAAAPSEETAASPKARCRRLPASRGSTRRRAPRPIPTCPSTPKATRWSETRKSPPGAFCRAGRVFLACFMVSAGKKEAALAVLFKCHKKLIKKLAK